MMFINPSRNRPVPLFVYGTLRQAGRLHDYWIEGAEMQPARAYGYELRVFRDHPAFPFMVAAEGGIVQGEVAWITDPSMLARVSNMEVNAGYRREWVSVEFDDHAVTIEALAFIYPHVIGDHVISDGDWITYVDENVGVAF